MKKSFSSDRGILPEQRRPRKFRVGRNIFMIEAGIWLNGWALPLYTEFFKPYTVGDSDVWATQIIITFFCLHISIEYWDFESE